MSFYGTVLGGSTACRPGCTLISTHHVLTRLSTETSADPRSAPAGMPGVSSLTCSGSSIPAVWRLRTTLSHPRWHSHPAGGSRHL